MTKQVTGKVADKTQSKQGKIVKKEQQVNTGYNKLPADAMIAVGEIVGAHGVKGLIKVSILSDFAEQRFAVGNLIFVEKLNKEFKIEQSQVHKGLYLLKLAGIDEREAVQALLHTYLKISLDQLKPLPEGEYYHFQLVGLDVYEGEEKLGVLSDIRQTGSNDVYIVKTVDGAHGGEILLPALKWVVKKIDLSQNLMLVEIPPGLLD